MDFYTDEDEFNSPCLLIESSQAEESPFSRQMEHDPLYLEYLMTADPRSAKYNAGNEKLGEFKMRHAVSGSGQTRTSTQSTSNNNRSTTSNNTQRRQGQEQASSSRSGGGGGGEGGDDGDDRRHHHNTSEPDVCNDSTEHSENSGSSSAPELIPVADKRPLSSSGCGDGSFPCDSITSIKLNTSLSNSSSSSAERTRHETHSDASTALADEVYQSRLESSEEIVPQLKKKSSSSSSSSSSMGKSKSDTSSSSVYPTSYTSSLTSSLSSDASPPFHPHLDPVREDSEQKDEESCSQDLFADKEDSNAMSSQEVSRISTPQDRSTPVENKQVKSHVQDLYRQVLTRTSTPLDSQELHTPPSHGEFNCLQFSGSSSTVQREVSHNSFTEVPLINPSSPTEHVYTTVTNTESSSSSGMIAASPTKCSLPSTPEEEQTTSHSSERQTGEHLTSYVKDQQFLKYSSTSSSDSIIPDSFPRTCRVPSTPEQDETSSPNKHDEQVDDQDYADLPRWQQQLISKERKSTASTSVEDSSSSTSNNGVDELEDEQDPLCVEWQSVQSSSKQESTTPREHRTTVKHVTFLIDKSHSLSDPISPQHTANRLDENDSLSPSLLLIDGQHGLAKLVAPRTNQKTSSCSQPELSEDLFNAATEDTQADDDSITKDNQDHCEPFSPVDTDEEQIEESQDFDLHLTQSQSDSSIEDLLPTNPMYKSLTQHTVSESSQSSRHDTELVQTSSNEKPSQTNLNTPNPKQTPSIPKQTPSPTIPKQTPSPTIPNQAPSPTIPSQPPVQVNPTSSGVPVLSSELSTESITSFHFSLPPTVGEVLVASTCTTPPPIPSWQPPVSDTSGEISTSDSNPPYQPLQPSLTWSMPRQDSPDSEHVGIALPINQPSTSAATNISTTSQPDELSVFARARKDAKRKRHGNENAPDERPTVPDERPTAPDEDNPFLFTSQDGVVCPPVSKRQKTKSNDNPLSEHRQHADTSESNSYIKTTTIRTITTLRTEVKRVITIKTTKEGSDDVVEELIYEEQDDPFIDEKADENVSEEIIVETGNCTYVRQPPPPPLPIDKMARVSPRRKRHQDNDEPSTKKRRLEKDNTVLPSPPVLRRQTTAETIPETDTPGNEARLNKGTRVYARWSDGFYYPGVVFGVCGFKSGFCYEVLFDDGDKRKIRPSQLIARNSLSIGQSVMAQDPDGYYDPGIIVGLYTTPTDKGYEIELQKTKQRKKYTKRFVILSEGQVRLLVRTISNSSDKSTSSTEIITSSSGGQSKSRDTSAKDTNSPSPLTTTRTVPDDAETPKSTRKTKRRRQRRVGVAKESSSDGDVEKRKQTKRVKRGILKKPSVPTRTSPRKKTTKQTNSSTSGSTSTSPRKSPQQGSTTSVPTRTSQQANSSTSGPTRTSPRKSKSPRKYSQQANTSTNVPTNDTIFAGFAFLITRCCNMSSDSESEQPEFDRALIVRQIEAGGGVILKDFRETQDTVADRCFLISNSYCRTVKYFQCLANGIPMVSHTWIHDCTALNTLQDYKNYLLPAGRSLETDEVMECTTMTNVLGGLTVYVHGSNQFKVTWSSVLLGAGAQVNVKLPNRPSRAAQLDDDELCDVVIAESPSLPRSLHFTCQSLGIPIVCLEWLFQCLINGYVVDFEGHPKYDYKNIADDNDVI